MTFQLRYSNDGVENFGPWRDLESGATGGFLYPLIARRLGMARHRVWQVLDTGNRRQNILAASIQLNGAGQWSDFPLPDGTYSDATRPWTHQDVCNYLPTPAEQSGGRSATKYETAPGLSPFAVVGDGPHRGARDVEGRMFVVSGRKLYRVDATGAATDLGTIPGTSSVSMTHNQVDGGNQLIIATGDNSYVYNTATGVLSATGVPLVCVDFINQLIVGVDAQRRFWRYSGLADATSWNMLDNESAESAPDRVVGLIVSQGEVLVFGERTIEVWQNSPTDNTAFQRGTVIERGCLSARTICRLDNSVFFVDNNGIPCRLQGYSPVPIAPKALIDEISSGDPTKLFAFTLEDKGYVIYYLTAQDGRTFGYDVTCQRWHRRESYGLDRWRINTLFKSNGDWYAGDYSNGFVYRLQWGYVYEGASIFPRSIVTGVLHSAENRVFINAFKLLIDSGQPEQEPVPMQDLPSTITISGHIPDGYVGDAVSGAYVVSGGIPPYGNVTLASGTFPSGLTLNTDGTYSGTFTTVGNYSRSVSGQDSVGQTATVNDSTLVGLAPPTIIMGTYMYWGHVGSLTTYPRVAPGSVCNGVMPVASNRGLVLAGRAASGTDLAIYEYDPTPGLYSLATIVGATPQVSGSLGIQYLAINAAGTRLFAISNGDANIYVLDRTDTLEWTVVETFTTPYANTASDGGMNSIVLSSDESKIAVANNYALVRSYSVATDGSLSALATSTSGAAYGLCRRIDWAGDYVTHGDDHPSGVIRVLHASDLTAAASYPSGGQLFLGMSADAGYVYLVGGSSPYAITVYAFNGTSLAPGNTYVTNQVPYTGSRLNPERTYLLYMTNAGAPSARTYAVSGATLTAGAALNGFSNGVWANPSRVAA